MAKMKNKQWTKWNREKWHCMARHAIGMQLWLVSLSIAFVFSVPFCSSIYLYIYISTSISSLQFLMRCCSVFLLVYRRARLLFTCWMFRRTTQFTRCRRLFVCPNFVVRSYSMGMWIKQGCLLYRQLWPVLARQRRHISPKKLNKYWCLCLYGFWCIVIDLFEVQRYWYRQEVRMIIEHY